MPEAELESALNIQTQVEKNLEQIKSNVMIWHIVSFTITYKKHPKKTSYFRNLSVVNSLTKTYILLKMKAYTRLWSSVFSLHKKMHAA